MFLDMEVDGWRVKFVIKRKWTRRVSLWVIKGLGSGLVDLSGLGNNDAQKIILFPTTGYIHLPLMTPRHSDLAHFGYDALFKVFCSVCHLTELRSEQLPREFLPLSGSTPSTHSPFLTNLTTALGRLPGCHPGSRLGLNQPAHQR